MGCPRTERATMKALCYPLLVSLALAMAAPGVPRDCFDYCKSQESEPITGAAPLECNCEGLLDTEIDSTEASVALDDTGVYFVPAEVHLFRERFDSKPFYISNPAKLIPKSRTTRINREFDASQNAFDDPIPSPSEHVEIFERTETISHTSINHEKYPVYLDLEIQKASDNERAATPEGILIQDFEATERALVECLDFQVLHYTRNYGYMKEFKKFWEVRNLNKYDRLSNLDIEKEINKYCKETESIIEESLHEIKQGLPKKRHEPKAVAEKENIIIDIHSMTESDNEDFINHAENTTAQLTLSPLSENVTQLSETDAKTTENAVSEQVTEIYDTTYNPLESWPFVHLTPSPISTEGVNEMLQSLSPVIEVVTDITTITTESTSADIDTEAGFRKADHKSQSTTGKEAELDLATMGSKDVLYKYNPTNITHSKINDDDQVTDHKIPLLPISTTSFSRDDYLEKESATTEVNTLNSETFNEFNTLIYDTSQILVNRTNSHIRNIYDEKEVKIPKIITKECPNNTVQSSIYGIEEIPNNDFKTRGKVGDLKYEMTGKVYFVAKNELVPIHFIQTDSGEVSLGIDGVSLCNKLVPIANKTNSLLAAVCNYVQNNVDQNKTIP